MAPGRPSSWRAAENGDEYEGPIALGEVPRDIDVASVSGQLIIVPALKLPSIVAGHRESPVDGLNLNRVFPGDPLGMTTRQIAAYMNDVLFPLGNAFIDLHSGGSSLDIIPSAIIEPGQTPEQHAANVRAVMAFDTRIAVVIDNRGDPRTATATAARHRMTVVGTELAGQGSVLIEALALCRQGICIVLANLGVLPAEMSRPVPPPRLYVLSPTAHGIVEDDGVFEPLHPLGTEVQAGMLAGRVHFLADCSARPRRCTTGQMAFSLVAASPALSALATAASSSHHRIMRRSHDFAGQCSGGGNPDRTACPPHPGD